MYSLTIYSESCPLVWFFRFYSLKLFDVVPCISSPFWLSHFLYRKIVKSHTRLLCDNTSLVRTSKQVLVLYEHSELICMCIVVWTLLFYYWSMFTVYSFNEQMVGMLKKYNLWTLYWSQVFTKVECGRFMWNYQLVTHTNHHQLVLWIRSTIPMLMRRTYPFQIAKYFRILLLHIANSFKCSHQFQLFLVRLVLWIHFGDTYWKGGSTGIL